MELQQYNPITSASDPEQGDAQAREASPKVKGLVLCGVLLVVLLLTSLSQVVLIKMQGSCELRHGHHDDWNDVIGPTTTAQLKPKFLSWFFHEVDVMDKSGRQVGFWSDLDLIFDIQTRVAYTHAESGAVEVEARSPIGFYLGKQYHVWRCADQDTEYYIEEDWWSKPWFNWNAQTFYTIKKVGGGEARTVARVKSEKADVFSIWGSHWEITVTSPEDETVAKIVQQTQSDAGWFGYQKWWLKCF
eukprot:SRR837773.18481.p1 GENE.SRR837773.18481~~SRR837773.18481.p1  ORF type:complete len:245 (+),score=88.21 SRR837773.18481:58-792(+)